MTKFDSLLEAEYVQTQSQRNLSVARLLYLANCCFILGFVAWDVAIDRNQALFTLLVRGIAAAFSFGVFCLSFIVNLKNYTYLFSYISALASHLAQSIVLISLEQGLVYGTTALTFFPLVLVALAPTSRSTLSVGALGFFLIPNLVMAIAKTDRFLWLNANVFLVATCLLFYILGMMTDRGRRQTFLLEKTLEQQATQDGLTGVANRRFFLELGSREFQRAQRYHKHLSLLLIDIDHFKRINDNYGHPIGDKAIIALTELICRVVRHTDIVGRIGGEEFAVLLTETDRTGAECVAERIRTAVTEMRLTMGGITIVFTVSIGGATLTADYKDMQHLIKTADDALYQAKGAGRNRVVIAKNGYD